jgi:flagella basal body P-ring formation protein FlgA
MKPLARSLVALTLLLGTAEAMAAPMLANRSVVIEPRVRLGDLFKNIEEKAGIEIDVAPAPGQSATYYSHQLMGYAKAYGLKWRPTSNLDRVIIERAGQSVPREVVEAEVRKHLAEANVPAEYELDFPYRSLRLFVAVDQAPSIRLENFTFESQTGSFTATASAPADDKAAERHAISGRIHTLTDVPVLTRRIQPGDAIRPADVGWAKLRASYLNRSNILDPRDLIGQTPTRVLFENQPLRMGDTKALIVVARNDTVTMTFQTPRMMLTTQAKALDDGAKGDTIRVANVNSKRVVEATVVGPNQVVTIGSNRVVVTQ